MFAFGKKKSVSSPPVIAPFASPVAELRHLYKLIEKLNIPVVADDYDAGYDTAISEVLDLIEGRIKVNTGE